MVIRAQSEFGYLTPAEFAAGLRQLRLDAASERAGPGKPVSERDDLLILVKS